MSHAAERRLDSSRYVEIHESPFTPSHVACGIVFVMAHWSGGSILSFRALIKALASIPQLFDLQVYLLDTDEQVAAEFMQTSPLLNRFGGWGETFWVKDGSVRHTLLRYSDEQRDDIIRYTLELLGIPIQSSSPPILPSNPATRAEVTQGRPSSILRNLLALAALLSLLITGVVGYFAGWTQANARNEADLDRVVVLSWGDGQYGPAFYGAHVYLVPRESGFSVRAQVHCGRGNPMVHDCGELGTVQTDAEAVARWGRIDWRDDGLHIGQGADEFFLSRRQLERHR